MKWKLYEYEGENIKVTYDLARCIHVEECVKSLPGVFDRDRRPWVDPDAGGPDEVAEVIRRCPTGALQYQRKDGGAQESAPSPNRVTVDPDGPLYLEGDIEIRTPDGETLLRDTRVALCRCGASGTKPFCDASHLGIDFSPADERRWQATCDLLVDSALSQPSVFVHRDYMPRNLMVSRPNPGVIDFQDAVTGAITYDVVSLFRDAFLSWPEERVAGWTALYREKADRAGLPVDGNGSSFTRALDWMGVQRHLKVIGIFARLHYRDGKPGYLADTPRFFRYIRTIAPRYTELRPLLDLVDYIGAEEVAGEPAA